jgi:cytidine deaminase
MASSIVAATNADPTAREARRGTPNGEPMSEIETRDIDWDALRAAARAAMRHAYAPYSNFPVGAAGLTTEGQIITGCNVENASYGLGLCAECGLVSALHATGAAPGSETGRTGTGPRLVAVAIVDGRGQPLTPCGRCRQLLWEHGGPQLPLETASGPRPLRELLPDAFGPDDLDRTRRTPEQGA